MKSFTLFVLFIFGSQLSFAGGHCNTSIANENTDTVYLSHETKEPISYQGCMKNLSNALKLAAKLCSSKKIPTKSTATISATYYSQEGSLTELITEGFYNCTHKKKKSVKRNLASKNSRKRKS